MNDTLIQLFEEVKSVMRVRTPKFSSLAAGPWVAAGRVGGGRQSRVGGRGGGRWTGLKGAGVVGAKDVEA
jgi:hypothetical protein